MRPPPFSDTLSRPSFILPLLSFSLNIIFFGTPPPLPSTLDHPCSDTPPYTRYPHHLFTPWFHNLFTPSSFPQFHPSWGLRVVFYPAHSFLTSFVFVQEAGFIYTLTFTSVVHAGKRPETNPQGECSSELSLGELREFLGNKSSEYKTARALSMV